MQSSTNDANGLVQTTWLVSMGAQIVSLGLSIAALATGDMADYHTLSLSLETGINVVQLGWCVCALPRGSPRPPPHCCACLHGGRYLLFYVLAYVYKYQGGTNAVWRYADWIVTTPCMLTTLHLLIRSIADECTTLGDIWSTRFVLANVAAWTANALMLLVGFMVESLRITPETEYTALVAGCIPLVFAYVPAVVLVTETYSGAGLALLIAQFLLWSLYGVVAILYKDDNARKVAAFNVCDIFSKNVTSIGIALLVLLSDKPSC